MKETTRNYKTLTKTEKAMVHDLLRLEYPVRDVAAMVGLPVRSVTVAKGNLSRTR